jgi:hypothetical protein
MSNWSIKGRKPPTLFDQSLEATTAGFYSARDRYTVKDTETGERRDLYAHDRREIGRSIATGKFARR